MNSTENEESVNETGAQLFARLIFNTQSGGQTQKQHALLVDQIDQNGVLRLDDKLFPEGVKRRDLIEIGGGAGVGKTELILHLISRCILPAKWTLKIKENSLSIDLSSISCNINGVELKRVVLIETDGKFNIMRLYAIIEQRIKSLVSVVHVERQLGVDEIGFNRLIKKFAYECFKNLIVYRCYSNEQFTLALAACQMCIQNSKRDNNVCPVFIDTIEFNSDVFDKYFARLGSVLGAQEQQQTERITANMLKKLFDTCGNVCAIVSTSTPTLSGDKCLWSQLVTRRVQFESVQDRFKPPRLEADEELDEAVPVAEESMRLKIVDKQETIYVKYEIKNDGFNNMK